MKIKNLLYFGLILIVVSFIFDIVFLGIPPQDPTDEMIESDRKKEIIEDLILWSGLLFSACGIISLIIKKLKSKFSNT